MTHDELIAKIKNNGTVFWEETGIKEEVETLTHRNDRALLAVVELHKPDSLSCCLLCNQISSNGSLVIYPCSTIQVIEKELERHLAHSQLFKP